MEDTTTEDVLKRFKTALGVNTDTELAKKFGRTQQAVSNARSKNKIPDSWFRLASKQYGVSVEWLYCGKGDMMHQNNTDSSEKVVYTMPCPNCVELKNELAREREERRELSAENRQLWRENGELKAQVAELKTKLANLSPPIMEQPHESSAKTA